MTQQNNGADLSGAIAQQQAQQGTASAFDLVSSMSAEFAKALPAEIPIEKFMRLAVTELRNNTDLQACSAPSLLGALMTAARLGLEVGGPMGHFYLTPRTLKGQGRVVVPIVGYRGLVELSRRAGVGTVKAYVVREGDHYAEGANSERGPFFDYIPGDGTGEWVGALAVARLAGGDVQHVYLSRAEVELRKSRGAAGNKGPWATDLEAMIRKTAIRALAGDLPQSSTLALARTADEQVQHYRAGDILPEAPETGGNEA